MTKNWIYEITIDEAKFLLQNSLNNFVINVLYNTI
jgi:hypothetical protein